MVRKNPDTTEVVLNLSGLWSVTRDKLLGALSPSVETGDLAYRATFTRAALLSLEDTRVLELCSGKSVSIWYGPNKHAVFYPIQAGEQFNLVLIRPDNLSQSVRSEQGDIGEMRSSFEGWDERLVITSVTPVGKIP